MSQQDDDDSGFCRPPLTGFLNRVFRDTASVRSAGEQLRGLDFSGLLLFSRTTDHRACCLPLLCLSAFRYVRRHNHQNRRQLVTFQVAVEIWSRVRCW